MVDCIYILHGALYLLELRYIYECDRKKCFINFKNVKAIAKYISFVGEKWINIGQYWSSDLGFP